MVEGISLQLLLLNLGRLLHDVDLGLCLKVNGQHLTSNRADLLRSQDTSCNQLHCSISSQLCELGLLLGCWAVEARPVVKHLGAVQGGNQLLVGDDLKDTVQRSALLSLPLLRCNLVIESTCPALVIGGESRGGHAE